MALALAHAGADIALIGRTAPTDTLEQLAAIGVKTHSIAADLSEASNVADIIDETAATLGRADILVNNAGIIKRNEAIVDAHLPRRHSRPIIYGVQERCWRADQSACQ